MSVFSAGKVRVLALCIVCGSLGLGIGTAIARQPQMEQALSTLRSAQSTLERVTLNKGGHAQRARQLVAEAIVQVQEGIEYGRANGL